MVHSNERSKKTDSPNGVVGEIDTRAPFHSVKDALNLFGEVASFGEKPAIKKVKPQSAEKVLVKQTQLHLAQKELNKLQDQLQNAEDTKSEALIELEKAKRTVEELLHRLKLLTESKEAAIQATETAKQKSKQLKEAQGENHLLVVNGFDSDSEREQYSNTFSQLNSAKQELVKIRQDYESCMEAKMTAINEAERAELGVEGNFIRASELEKEIFAMKETIKQVKQASVHSIEERAKIFAEKEFEKQCYSTKLEESAKKLEMMKERFDPDVARNLETRIEEATTEIEGLKNEVDDMNLVEVVTSELDGAKEYLKKVLEEEKVLQKLVESLEKEVENVRKEHSELREKEAEMESFAGSLHVELRMCKSELETALAEEVKVNGVSDEMIATLNRLKAQAEEAEREAEEMKTKLAELKKVAVETRLSLAEAERRLEIALEEVEEAEMAEARARDGIKAFSDQTACSSKSEAGAKVTISRDEFQALSKKAVESEKLAEMKVEAAIAQVEAIKASENEAVKQLEASQKEIEDIRASTQEVLKKAEMAEAAKRVVESELRRWREREQKKVSEAATRILAEAQSQAQTKTESKPGHINYEINNRIASTEKAKGGKKSVKQRTSISKKVLLPSLSGMFHKNKNQVDGESPSYLPGES